MSEKSSKSHLLNILYSGNVNNYKFVLYQGEDVINERIFSADQFNPVVRYFVDIRDIIPSIIQRLQKTLSRKNLNFKDHDYDFLTSYKNQISLENKEFVNKLSKPAVIKQNFSGKTIKGVECKFGLYINDNPIVERKFYVDNYNPACRFSTEIVSIVNDVCEEIYTSLKNNDVNHMWEDYTLINTYGLHVNQIRELNHIKRGELLENVSDRVFVKKTKSYYRSLQPQVQQQQVNIQ